MNHVDVCIGAKDDESPLFPEFADAIDTPCLGFAILDRGTVSGKTSCGVIAKGQDGKSVMIQFTGDMFLTMAAALKGARQRFGDPWDGV